jgi:hypothetical protein
VLDRAEVALEASPIVPLERVAPAVPERLGLVNALGASSRSDLLPAAGRRVEPRERRQELEPGPLAGPRIVLDAERVGPPCSSQEKAKGS